MPQPIRLALVITELEPGGAERCLVNLTTRLDREQFEPAVYSLGPPPREGQDLLVEQLAAARVPTHFLGLTHWSQYFRGVRRLAALLAEHRPQVVQAFLLHANVLAARAAGEAQVPHVCTGIRVADPRRTRTSLERWATRRADRFVCVSQSVAEFCRRRGFAGEKLVVIPNGIEVERWKDARPADLTQFGVPSGRRAIAFVGRLDRQKGLIEFFDLLQAVFDAAPNHDLLLVGDGPERLRLKQAAQRTAIAEKVHFAGWQSDVPAIVAACDLVVLPSRWEGMPNAILESMAAGKPVVATRTEGIAELLGDASRGQTVELENLAQMAKAIGEILANPSRASDLGRQNQARADAEFGLQSMVRRYEALYQTLVQAS
jgi:glycosyltransferase involved in cell wall biosynthesis